MASCSSCSHVCQSWSACSVTCGNGTRTRTNNRGCMDKDICSQPICQETSTMTTQGITREAANTNSTVAPTPFATSNATARRNITEASTMTTQGIPREAANTNSTVAPTSFATSNATGRKNITGASDTGNDLLPVKVAVPVGVCLFVAVVFTVFLLKRRSKRQSAKNGENVDVPTQLTDIPDCGTSTEKDASNIIDSDTDRSSTYDINPLYDSSNTEHYYNHVRRNETDIFPEYTSVIKRKHEHIESSNQYDYTTFNGAVGNDKTKEDLQ